eukprot:1302559-Pleurochrysis_carterae.AAC.1
MQLVGGADLNGTASGDPSDLRFDRPYRASPTGLIIGLRRLRILSVYSGLRVYLCAGKVRTDETLEIFLNIPIVTTFSTLDLPKLPTRTPVGK